MVSPVGDPSLRLDVLKDHLATARCLLAMDLTVTNPRFTHTYTHTLTPFPSVSQVPHRLFKESAYDHREAMFGRPPYGKSISQNVYYADSYMCTNEKNSTLKKAWELPFILLVNRGGDCSSVRKVRRTRSDETEWSRTSCRVNHTALRVLLLLFWDCHLFVEMKPLNAQGGSSHAADTSSISHSLFGRLPSNPLGPQCPTRGGIRRSHCRRWVSMFRSDLRRCQWL